MKASVSQFKSVRDIETNLRTIREHIATAAASGSALICFPEASMVAYESTREELVALAEQHAARFIAEVSASARAHAIEVFVGLYEPLDGLRTRNTFVHIGADGALRGRYDKLHLYDAFSFKESDKNRPGVLQPDHDEVYVSEIGGLRFAILNCYDLRFPEISRIAVDRGADVLLYGAGWIAGSLKELHWETLLRARAIENTCYVLASCQPPPSSVGMSMAVDPGGLVIGGIAAPQGVVTVELQAQRLRDVRRDLPCLEHRRYQIAPHTTNYTGDPQP
jgi:predicted amidohydrolase